MTWCHDRAVPLIQTSTAIELYKGQNSCVHCNFTLHHCKFTVLPDPLIVNLQCAGPQHCKSTVGTTCERDPKEMDFTMGIQWFYSGHTVYLQCAHCKIIQCRELLSSLPQKKNAFLRPLHCKTTVNLQCNYLCSFYIHCKPTVNSTMLLQWPL